MGEARLRLLNTYDPLETQVDKINYNFKKQLSDQGQTVVNNTYQTIVDGEDPGAISEETINRICS